MDANNSAAIARGVLLIACGLMIAVTAVGCAWWQDEPQNPRTVEEWMERPKVRP
jgi:hypothetical protein